MTPLDEALADHRVLTHEEALTVARALEILEKHSAGIRNHGPHPDNGHAADIIDSIAAPLGQLLNMMLNCGMVAPRGYVPGGAE